MVTSNETEFEIEKMSMKRVFVIGAGFSKAACNRAPIGRELLKHLENTLDSFSFSSDINSYSPAIIELLRQG